MVALDSPIINAYHAIIDAKGFVPVASITIRNLDEETKRRLRVRAAQLNRSMEEEARDILRAALAQEAPSVHLVDQVQARFRPLGGVQLTLPEREAIRQPPDFLAG